MASADAAAIADRLYRLGGPLWNTKPPGARLSGLLRQINALGRIGALTVIILQGSARCDDPNAASAERFVRDLYASLVASGDALKDPLTNIELLEPELAALYRRYGAAQTGPGIEISLCNCQEGPVTNGRVRARGATPDRAEVEAIFNIGPTQRVMRLLLVATGAARWRVADLQDWSNPARPWSVRRGLALDLATTPGPVQPADTFGRWAGQDCRRDWTDWRWDGRSLSFASPTGGVDVERWVAPLSDGFATETVVGTNSRPGVRWEYHFGWQEVRVRNVATGRSFSLKPCA